MQVRSRWLQFYQGYIYWFVCSKLLGHNYMHYKLPNYYLQSEMEEEAEDERRRKRLEEGKL